MRILFFNWKDIKHPNAGGAEVFTHEVAKRLVAHGHEVSLFASRIPSGPTIEVIDGVEIFRQGNAYSVQDKGRRFLYSNKRSFDAVVEEVNTRPFFARPLSEGTRYVVIIHQLAREFWNMALPVPLSTIGLHLLEPYWLSRLKYEQVLVPSPSTMSDLIHLGFTRVSQFRYGISHAPLAHVETKEGPPTIMFVGRLRSTKKPEDAVRAFLSVRRIIPDAKMQVLGGGPLLKKLRSKYSRTGISFLGPTYGNLKLELMRKASLLLVPGVREGWGLVVTEANSMGTPAIAYDVPGLRDSVRDGETGILVPRGNHLAMATAAIALLQDHNRYDLLCARALDSSREFTWDSTVKTIEKYLAS